MVRVQWAYRRPGEQEENHRVETVGWWWLEMKDTVQHMLLSHRWGRLQVGSIFYLLVTGYEHILRFTG